MIIRISNISIQRFLPEHTDILHRLISHPNVRQGMSNSAEIPYANHLKWVKENLLEGENTHLFVTIHKDHGQGVVLIKNISSESGELGIMVNDIPAARKTLLISKLLTGILYYAFSVLNLRNLIMRIIPGNTNSLIIAKKFGADYQGQDDIYQNFLLEKYKYQSSSLHRLLIKRYQPEMEELSVEEKGIAQGE